MNIPKIFVHGSYIGNTGYNQHTRDFFRSLSNYAEIKVRNFTIGDGWKGYNPTPHEDEKYINDIDRKLLYEQILWDNNRNRNNFPIYSNPSKEFKPDLNIILCETDHHIFYDNYKGPKIAYNVWESTLQPEHFFNKLKEFDELWVPSKWQRDCTIAQGYDPNKIKVVPEGVDSSVFYPNPQVKHELTSDGRFKFFLAGRWDYRKSTKEIIEVFLKTFDKSEPVDLIVSIDNPFSNDELKTTEDRLKHYNLEDDRIKIIHFPPRLDYIDILKSCNVFVSCARSEGWNLPLLEAMSCGVPSIYSNCSGQLEFAEGRGIPVNILGLRPASDSSYNHFNETIGEYYEPDFEELSTKMRFAYEFYSDIKKISLEESEEIRKQFSWENVAQIGYNTIENFMKKIPFLSTEIKTFKKNRIEITYLDGPKVEILGDEDKIYLVEFVNKQTNEVLHSSTIKNNMWTACGKKYYIPWQIRINGEVVDEFNLENQNVLISMESKSLGDTLAWVPYSIEFAKKYKCKVIISTFHNYLFEGLDEYKDIKFINPGKSHECIAVYKLGWFKKNDKWEDFDKNPNQVNIIPLQQAATDILGLDFKEVNYGIKMPNKERPIKNKYVVFGPQATAGCKEWVYNYWVELSKLLIKKGYDIVTLTKSPFIIEGVKNYSNKPMKDVINILNHADIFIGLGSGLSWLNWAIGKHTYMINGFAKEGHEFTKNVTRIQNQNVCISCWNDDGFVFDGGDWDWCPLYKGTKKQHICQKSISPEQVFNKLNLVEKKKFICPEGEENITENFIKEIFDENEYNRFGIKIEIGDNVLDAGGNVGIFSNYAHQMGASKIFSYEINENFYQCLLKNTENLPVVSTLGKVGVDDFDIRKILEQHKIVKINFAKIDIEGDEWDLFEKIHVSDLLKVNKWAIEFHTHFYSSNFDDSSKKELLWKFMKILHKFNTNGFQTFFEHIHESWDVVHLFAKKI